MDPREKRSNSKRKSGNHYLSLNRLHRDNSDESKNELSHLNKRFKFDKRKRRIALIVASILVIFLVIFGVRKWFQARDAANSIFSSSNIQKSRNVSSTLKQNKPISILLLGTDTGALGRNYRGRTDTIIVATLNPGKEKMTLTSIPRDTLISVPGYSDYGPSKINAAYDYGGAGTAIKAVEKLLNIPIDFYGLINMGGLEKIVNGVGGVDVTPPLTFKYGNADVKKGVKIHLNGKAALDYSRMRHQDPQGDYGRQGRQRQILMAILRKSDSITTLLNENFMDSLKSQTQTDLSFDELVALSTNYRVATHHLKSTHLQGVGAVINGVDFEVAPHEEMQRVTNFIRSNLGLDKADTGTTGVAGYGEDTSTDDSTSSSSASSASSSSEAAAPAAPATQDQQQQAPATQAQQQQVPQQSTTTQQQSDTTTNNQVPAR
ncbi:LCP family protein [Pediococcus claussenii]|uniref:Cell envelope-related function transcriptional attenuator common domain protein n=1 Tax=Pediococcus claussenii (strain ATCC BAA-344 / DSM 14800 / JCM 18046 / KCTC 3811 / LMG 21948 / P06) TaxID=701521 RepID=G8PE69_PEDCP|nr:LCP family protein [Pediococcus claussenii]AEV95554.1 cell envelope-related function transcriptional attenuator common domain protein [Pediococcus claussenii ATCC BAA-344]ANZ69077.1 transcriptional regulator [Pediococcus claussenii]ANZ70893.1 transcriptional regulator [Pediococcus claussenii]KRN20212.1 hypothetical protein IV79_GL000879 [Pediococcus claussenii]